MTIVLAEREGWVYAKATIDHFEPRQIIHWWPLGLRWHDFKQYFADEPRAREALGGELSPTSNTSYKDVRGWSYRLPEGGQTKPAFTDLVPIAPPKQPIGRLPFVWKDGAWHKQTVKGLVKLRQR